jgi:hypothetical protein
MRLVSLTRDVILGPGVSVDIPVATFCSSSRTGNDAKQFAAFRDRHPHDAPLKEKRSVRHCHGPTRQ